MDFQIGDVVMFMGHGYLVVDFDDDVNLLILTDGISTTSDVDYEDVIKIGHDDTFEQNIIDRIKNVQLKNEQELSSNQAQLIGRLKDVCFKDPNSSQLYLITGKTKADGKYSYFQVHSNNGYEWILMEELFDRFFK